MPKSSPGHQGPLDLGLIPPDRLTWFIPSPTLQQPHSLPDVAGKSKHSPATVPLHQLSPLSGTLFYNVYMAHFLQSSEPAPF